MEVRHIIRPHILARVYTINCKNLKGYCTESFNVTSLLHLRSHTELLRTEILFCSVGSLSGHQLTVPRYEVVSSFSSFDGLMHPG